MASREVMDHALWTPPEIRLRSKFPVSVFCGIGRKNIYMKSMERLIVNLVCKLIIGSTEFNPFPVLQVTNYANNLII